MYGTVVSSLCRDTATGVVEVTGNLVVLSVVGALVVEVDLDVVDGSGVVVDIVVGTGIVVVTMDLVRNC